ncbi:MAG: peptidase C39 family protein [Nitrososphaerota archaeon]|jgi:hypothetical protein|nr:peptidase C39 family protein [Nitrososphaerota archaeon]
MIVDTKLRLEVPFYRQSFDFTCGPASLMMVMKYLDREMKLSKSLEMDIWREASMVEIYGASRYGLAFSAAIRGFGARVISNLGSYGFVDKLEPRIEGVNRSMMRLFFLERKRRCMELGVEDVKGRIKSTTLFRELTSFRVPLLLMDGQPLIGEDVPHWVVVTGHDRGNFYINNPLSNSADDAIQMDRMEKMIGYKGDECLVSVFRNERLKKLPEDKVRFLGKNEHR